MLFYRNTTSKPPDEMPEKALLASLGVVEAHSQYLKAIYYVPFSIPFNPVEEGLQQLSDLVAVGDLYDSMKPLWAPLECLINRNVDVVRIALKDGMHCSDFLQIALKLEIDWLFKDSVTPIPLDFAASPREPGIRDLDWIDLKLLTIEIPTGKVMSHDIAVLQIREKIIQAIRQGQQGTWNTYSFVYPDIWLWFLHYRTLIEQSAWLSSEKDDIYSLLEDTKRKVSDIVRPLYRNGLSSFCKEVKKKYGKDQLLESDLDYRCIEIPDEELPWIAAQAKGEDDHHHSAS
ncbi:MAG: hypothetical protein Q9221_005270 [Calogaya cf. arnoldii]